MLTPSCNRLTDSAQTLARVQYGKRRRTDLLLLVLLTLAIISHSSLLILDCLVTRTLLSSFSRHPSSLDGYLYIHLLPVIPIRLRQYRGQKPNQNMGGHAFGGNAERLSTAQLEALRNYCRDRLSSILSNIGVLRSVTSKLTHSDLDLVGGLPLCHGDFFRGSDSGRLSRSGESLGICHSVQLSKKLRGEKRSREEARIEEANSLVNKAAEAIGAIEWARCGNTSFYKVPCDRLYPEMASDVSRV